MDEATRVYPSVPEATGLTDRFRALISDPSHPPPLDLHRHQTLYAVGQPDCGRLYLIETGHIKTLTVSGTGKVCLFGIYREGDVVGESALMDEERTETAVAMVPSRLWPIPRTAFLAVLADCGLREEWLRYLGQRLTERQQVIAHMVTATSEERLAATLLRLGRKLGRWHRGRLRIDQRITHEEFAGMVGTTRSRVGYFLKQFRRRGLIESTDDGLLVIDHERLDDYVAISL
jgi:CRP/FNR family cyclic AMP-dependent transcriptional regulator